VSAPHLKTDAQGDMHSKGHPKRDTLLWAIPPLWPIKIITLPNRGPYPALKGESRLSLRVMEDVELPTQTAKNVPMPPWASPASYQMSSTPVFRPASLTTQEPVAPQRVTFSKPGASEDDPMTVVALHAGTAVLAQRYWVEGGKLHCVADGVEQEIPLEKVDLARTVKLNQERNVEFVLQSKDSVEQ
ncbi:MAG TPA: hypothetical protein VF753_00440, partial [Terriglobales bacterium]